MDITIASLKEVQWSPEDYSVANAVATSCLSGRCFRSKRKARPDITTKNIFRLTSGYQLSKKAAFLHLLDGDILERVVKHINKNAKTVIKCRKSAQRWGKVEQEDLLAWLGVTLWTGLFGFSMNLTKESIDFSNKRCLKLFDDRFEDILCLLYKAEGKNMTVLFQEINLLQEKLAVNFSSSYQPTQTLCIKKYKVELKGQQLHSDLRIALLMDVDTQYICNFYIYSISCLLNQAECIPLIYILRKLLMPFKNKNCTVQIDSSAYMNESIHEEFSKCGINIEFGPSFTEHSTAGAVFTPEYRTTRKNCDRLSSDLNYWAARAIFPLSGREPYSFTFVQVFWLLVHLSCINAFILYSAQDSQSSRDLSLEEFMEILSRELNECNSFQSSTSCNKTTSYDVDQESDSYSDASCEDRLSVSSDAAAREDAGNKQRRMQGVTGLYNLGNTCYMNAGIQCLSSTAPLVQYFLSGQFHTTLVRGKGDVAKPFADLMADMWLGKSTCASPEAFWFSISKVHPTFGRQNQQDAQEFLIYTLNELHEDLTHTVKKRPSSAQGSTSSCSVNDASDSSIITRLLQGQLRYDTVCLKCENTSPKTEIFTILSLPIAPGIQCSLQECLECFFQKVTLPWTDKIYCSCCTTKQNTSVKVSICKPPKIIIFHLKRFEYQGQIKRKLKTNVTFPVKNLDLSSFISPIKGKHPKYNLYAVLNHFGELDHGHYTAYCKNTGTKQWHAFDDTKSSNIQEATVQTSAAYILFYTSQPFCLPTKKSSLHANSHFP
ncbi:hypothetical protein FKM82_004763 [Ascaphus truei]